ncbi:MAG: hypothetical protein ACPL3B_02540 [Fervidobacterium sp.]
MLSSDGLIEQWFWKENIHSYLQPFPRDLGKFRYPKAHCMKDYISYILKSNLNREDAYVAFYSDEEIEKGYVDRIFIDIDGVNVEEIWANMKPFLSIFWNHLHVFFSGMKGFHVIVYIQPVLFDELLSNRQRLYEVLSTWCQTVLDRQTFLDRKRIYRITFTYHSKANRWKIPVHFDWNINSILSLSRNPDFQKFSMLRRKVTGVNYKIFLKEPYEIISEKLFQGNVK